MSSRIKSLLLVLVLAAAAGQDAGCPISPSNQTPVGSFTPVAPVGSILLTLENNSHLSVVVQANFVASGQQVRQTTRLLSPDGPESSARIFRTTADEVDVSARIATPNDGSSTKYVGGFLLAEGHFALGVDYADQGSVDFMVLPPPADCNGNGVPDATEIASGASRDCDRDGIPDECEPGLPTIQHCAGNLVISADANGHAQMPDLTGLIAAVDSCTPISQLKIVQDQAVGTPLVLDQATKVTLTVTDGDGNATQCQSTVTMIDDAPPTLVCPGRVQIFADSTCHATVPDFSTLVTASDNTTPKASLVFAQDRPVGQVVSLGAYPVSLSVSDESGNAQDCSILLRVTQNRGPGISECSDAEIAADLALDSSDSGP